jgi:FlaA1/EpsC-like NDP-sugar epimerase
VTGAGGSIGSELCRQIAKYIPGELIMLDRDETGLQGAQIGISGHGLLNTRDVVLADIRDEAALAKIFAERKPDVVFHAAALKHLPMLEQYPDVRVFRGSSTSPPIRRLIRRAFSVTRSEWQKS